MSTFREIIKENSITNESLVYPKGIFLIVSSDDSKIVDGSYFEPNSDKNDFTDDMVKKINNLPPLSKLSQNYLKSSDSYDNWVFRIK